MSDGDDKHFYDHLEGADADASLPQRTPAAVALGMPEGEGVPKVLASGRGLVAEQILQLAFEQGISVREDADLVEVLTALEIDMPIPVEAFAAVAEIMAYVYKANASYAQRAPHQTTD